VKSDFVEPEALFWAAWKALDRGEQAEIAREAVGGFVERVEQAATKDPRATHDDPMDPHRHRVHPLLWKALAGDPGAMTPTLERELQRFLDSEDHYLKRRPIWSPAGHDPPWE
jgi:hypothetical protein